MSYKLFLAAVVAPTAQSVKCGFFGCLDEGGDDGPGFPSDFDASQCDETVVKANNFARKLKLWFMDDFATRD